MPTAPVPRRLPRALAGALLAVAALLAAVPAARALDADAAAALRAGLERLRGLRAERPGDGILVYYEALLHARLGERDAAVQALQSLRGRRLGLVPAAGIGFETVWGDPAFARVREALAAEEPRTPDAPVAFRLPDAGIVPEGIAHDPASGRFAVGSIARHAVLIQAGDGWREFSTPDDRLDAVLGLAVDARRGALLAVSTNAFEDSGRQARRNAVVRWDLASGRRTARVEVPEAAQLNDVAVAPDGTLVATDSEAAAVYAIDPERGTATPLVAPGRAPGANGIAVAPTGEVYVALSTGIGRIDRAAGSVARLPQPDGVATGGIDGLYWHAGDLVGVQNSTNPGRVVRIRLADDGRRIAGLDVLQSHHHPAFEEPTTGVVVGPSLLVIANSHVQRYRGDGTLTDPASMRPAAVIAVPLRPAAP